MMRWLGRLCLLVLLCAAHPAAAWTLVQTICTNVSATSWTWPAAVSNGSIVAGGIFYTDTATTNDITGINDNQSNTYPVIQFKSANPTQQYNIDTFWSGGKITNGPTSLSITTTGAPANIWICVGEFTPSAGTLGTDGSTAQYQNVSNPTAGSITTTQNGDLVIAIGGIASDNITANGSGYTTLAVGGSGSDIRGEYQTQSSAGAINGNFVGTITDGIFAMFALSATSAGATCPMTRSLMGVG